MTLSGQLYQCSAGETFDSAALDIYGSEKYACELLNANPALCQIPIFSGGELLNLPVVEVPEETDDNAYIPSSVPWKE